MLSLRLIAWDKRARKAATPSLMLTGTGWSFDHSSDDMTLILIWYFTTLTKIGFSFPFVDFFGVR